MTVFQTIVTRSIARSFCSSAFQSTVKTAVHKCLAYPHATNDVTPHAVEHLALMVLVRQSIKIKDEKRSVVRSEMYNYRNVSNMEIMLTRKRRKTISRHIRLMP